MKKIIFCILVISNISFSHHLDRMNRDENSYQAEGRLILFQVKPGDNFMRIYLVGKEAAKVNFSDKSELLTVTLFHKGKKEKIPFKNVNDYYQLESIPQKGPYDLEMEATVDGEPDKVRMSIGKP